MPMPPSGPPGMVPPPPGSSQQRAPPPPGMPPPPQMGMPPRGPFGPPMGTFIDQSGHCEGPQVLCKCFEICHKTEVIEFRFSLTVLLLLQALRCPLGCEARLPRCHPQVTAQAHLVLLRSDFRDLLCPRGPPHHPGPPSEHPCPPNIQINYSHCFFILFSFHFTEGQNCLENLLYTDEFLLFSLFFNRIKCQ